MPNSRSACGARPLIRLLLALALTLSTCAASPGGSSPNVLLISIDCLNQRQFEEGIRGGYIPHLAALASDSIAFSRAYTQAPWTTPAHMSLMTGLYPTQHGRDTPYGAMIEVGAAYDRVPEFTTLADELSQAGYETVGFVGEGPISATYGLGQGFDTFLETAKDPQKRDLPKTLSAFREWLAERPSTPFFAFVHTFDLHYPLPMGVQGRQTARSVLPYIDAHIGMIVAMLREAKLYDDTVIVLTGDHGSEMVKRAGKCCVHGAGHYEENLRVPLLLRPPGGGDGRSSNALARHIDVFPTLMELLGRKSNYDGPGVSLLDIADGANRVRFSYSEADGRCAKRFGLVSESHKYIYTPHGPEQDRLRADYRFNDAPCGQGCGWLPREEEFYDLRNDRWEERDLLRGELSPEQASVLSEMRGVLAAHRGLAPRYRAGQGDSLPRTTDDLERSLRSLGYLE